MLPLARSILAAMRQQHNIYKIEGGVILENQISCLDKRGHYKPSGMSGRLNYPNLLDN